MWVFLRLDSTPHRYFEIFFFDHFQFDLHMNLCGRDISDLTSQPEILCGDTVEVWKVRSFIKYVLEI
jgi:hypothetical protein